MSLRVTLWGRLSTCGPIVNRPAQRFSTAAQLTKLPHKVEWLMNDSDRE